MPKVGIFLCSSFEKLFHTIPDPSKFHVFDCLCFPWLRPYSSHKLDPKSSMCVFFGYSLTQSAFLYFDPTLKKNLCVPSCQVYGEYFPILFPTTPTSSVIDTNSALSASSFTSGDLPTPLSSTYLSSTSPSPSPTSRRPSSPQPISSS